jgi:hypothetical protein
MKERDELHQTKLAGLRNEIGIGVDQADRGHVKPFNKETTSRVKANGRKRLATLNGSDPGSRNQG